MPFPFSAMPTLGQFVERAVEQGCRDKKIHGMVGQDGELKARYLGACPRIRKSPGLGKWNSHLWSL